MAGTQKGFETIIFKNKKARKDVLTKSLATLLFLAASFYFFEPYINFLSNPSKLRGFISSFPVLSPLIFIGVQIIQILVAPIPGQIIGVAGGYLFGAFKGTVYSMIGVTIGSAIAFWLSRKYGRPYVESKIDMDLMAGFDEFIEKHGRKSVFLIFLIPGLPDDAVCFVSGLTKIPLRQLVVLALIARTPAFLLASMAGSSLAASEMMKFGVFSLVLVLSSVIGYLKLDEIQEYLDKTLPG
ncbi:TVP38/TMEM64 family protein [Candidatus Nanohalococcus occultus]|uniref:TVP38/TMEM64 family protein n=1 Tax=Candidatus Nanohalococcus occultus TaxID=2978047 RepID=UPI0039E16911